MLAGAFIGDDPPPYGNNPCDASTTSALEEGQLRPGVTITVEEIEVKDGKGEWDTRATCPNDECKATYEVTFVQDQQHVWCVEVDGFIISGDLPTRLVTLKTGCASVEQDGLEVEIFRCTDSSVVPWRWEVELMCICTTTPDWPD